MPAADLPRPAVLHAVRSNNVPLDRVSAGPPPATAAVPLGVPTGHWLRAGPSSLGAAPRRRHPSGFGFVRPPAPIQPTGPNPTSLLPPSTFSCCKPYPKCGHATRPHCQARAARCHIPDPRHPLLGRVRSFCALRVREPRCDWLVIGPQSIVFELAGVCWVFWSFVGSRSSAGEFPVTPLDARKKGAGEPISAHPQHRAALSTQH